MKPYDAGTDKIYLDFGGFYETWHDRLLQDAEVAAFINAYREAYPDDKEAEEWADHYGYGMDELYTAPDRMLEVFNHKWKYDNHAAARHYLTEMLDFVGKVYGLGLQLDDINYTYDELAADDGWRVRLVLEMMVARCCPVGDEAERDLPTDENWFEYAWCNLDCEMGGDFGRIE